MAHCAVLLKDSLAAVAVAPDLEGFLVRGDHVLPARQAGGEDPGRRARTAGSGTSEQIEPGGVDVRAAHSPGLNRVEKRAIHTGRAKIASAAVAPIWGYPGPRVQEDAGNPWVVLARQRLHGRHLDLAGLPRSQPVGHRVTFIIE